MKEHEKAKAWRERLGLSRKQLADLTGYSYESVKWFENGRAPPRSWSTSAKRTPERDLADAPNGQYAWQRFKRCCQAVEHELRTGVPFQW